MKIDLNADLGEGCASDSALLQLVSSANIACGFHAGDAVLMQQCVREALKNGVAIGAHPSFPDRENFGRTAMQLPPETVYARCAVPNWRAGGNRTRPGGRAAARQTAWHVVQPGRRKSRLWPTLSPVRCAMPTPTPVLVGLAGSELIRAGQHYQLTTRQEVFADRGYLADGSPGAA